MYFYLIVDFGHGNPHNVQERIREFSELVRRLQQVLALGVDPDYVTVRTGLP